MTDTPDHDPVLVRAIRDVVAAFPEDAPLSIRQVYWRLVLEHGHPYDPDRFMALINSAAVGMHQSALPMGSVVDEMATGMAAVDFRGSQFGCGDIGWANRATYIAAVEASAAPVRLNRQRGQDRVVVIATPFSALQSQLRRIGVEHSVPTCVVHIDGWGAISTISRLAEAKDLVAIGPLDLLVVSDIQRNGQLEPQLLDYVESVAGIANGSGGDVRWFPILTPALVDEHGLPAVPARGGEIVEVAALRPDVLRQLVLAEIERRIDPARRQAVLIEEERATADLELDFATGKAADRARDAAAQVKRRLLH